VTPYQSRQFSPMTEVPVWGMVLTPFAPDNLAVDHASLALHVRALLDQGAHGVVALAVIAEPGALAPAERAAVLDTVLDAAATIRSWPPSWHSTRRPTSTTCGL